MDAVARRNALEQPRSQTLEYAVRGVWRRSATDAEGEKGTWYVDVPTLVETFGAEAVEAKLAEYAASMAAARTAAITEAVAAAAAAEE